MSTLKQRERIVKKAVAAMEKAADCLGDLQRIGIEFGVKDMTREEMFADGLRERTFYWERCEWWKKDPEPK